MRVSRAGVVLIKSFEGFRPRAVRGADGRWTIGYGHTRSAREGLTVSEADAELLLQYDLLPVVETLNAEVAPPLNQHQFDALASFAFSVGVEAFRKSDVLARLNGGDGAAAADAFAAWPEPESADVRRRRRAAERALFFADPTAPVSLAELLAAPLPDVEAAPQEAVPDETALASDEPPIAEGGAETEVHPATLAEAAPTVDARTAALAMLLGEPADPEPEPPAADVSARPALEPEAEAAPTPLEAETRATPPDPLRDLEAEADAHPAFEADRHDVEVETVAAVAVGETAVDILASQAEDAPAEESLAALTPEADPASVAVQPASAVEGAPDDPPQTDAPAASDSAAPAPAPEAPPAAGLMAMQRLSPYSAVALAPLPGLQTLTFGTPVAEPAPEPVAAVLAPQPAPETPPVLPPVEPRPLPEPPIQPTPEPPVFSPPTVAFPVEQPQPTFALTPPTEDDLPVLRPSWSEHDRFETPGSEQAPLFEEVPAASIIRHEEPPARQGPDWSQITPFWVMFVIGLASCAFSAAAFRRALEEPLPLDEYTIAGWALALIGVICVSVSAYSLYKRLGGTKSEAA